MIRDILIKDEGYVYHKVMKISTEPIIKSNDSIDDISYQIKMAISKIFKRFAKNNIDKLFTVLVEDIKNIHNEEDAEIIFFKFIKSYLDINKYLYINTKDVDTVVDGMKTNKNFIVNRVLSYVVDTHYSMVVSKLSKTKLLSLLSLNDNELKEYFKNLGVELPIGIISDNDLNNRVNTYIVSSVKNNIYYTLFNDAKHLCWDCPANICLNCPKVEFKEKETIDNYPFIGGFQVYEDGELERFIVSNCKKMRINKKLS